MLLFPNYFRNSNIIYFIKEKYSHMQYKEASLNKGNISSLTLRYFLTKSIKYSYSCSDAK